MAATRRLLLVALAVYVIAIWAALIMFGIAYAVALGMRV